MDSCDRSDASGGATPLRGPGSASDRERVEAEHTSWHGRMLRTHLRVGLVLSAVFGVAWASLVSPAFAWVYLGAFLGWLGTLRLLDATGRPVLCGRIGCAILFGVCVSTAALLGGLHSNSLSWLLLMPVAAATATVDRRETWAWAGASALAACGFFFWAEAGRPADAPLMGNLAPLVLIVLGLGVTATLCQVWRTFQTEAERRLDALLEAQRSEGESVRLFRDVATLVSRDVSFEPVAADVLRLTCESLDFREAEIWSFRPSAGTFLLRASHPVALSASPLREPGTGPLEELDVPIAYGSERLGSLRLRRRPEREPRTNTDEILSSIAGELSHALARERTRDSLRLAAEVDDLTGLPNRRAFRSLLNDALCEARRHERTLGLLYIDLNGFKRINDSLGHAVGDRVLREVARRITQAIRGSDAIFRSPPTTSEVARLGGDEFTVILDEIADPASAEVVAHRILANLARPTRVDGQELYLGASIGIGVFPEDAGEMEALIQCADSAMYAAKRLARSGCRRYHPNQDKGDPLALEADLRVALRESRIRPHYQPIVTSVSGEVVGAELLLRWHHPLHGWIPPVDFVGLAERVGLISELGNLVLEEGLAFLEAHHEQLGPGFRLSLNVSPKQIEDLGFLHRVARRLASSPLPNAMLELEVTETVLMVDSEETWEHIEALAGLGVGFALDDFGTGYSSLSLLKQMPIHRIKIDRSFVRGLPDEPRDVAIVGAILGMAASLGIRVVAEGVEDEAHQAFLAERGCQELQGWLFAKAMEPEAFLEWVATRGNT